MQTVTKTTLHQAAGLLSLGLLLQVAFTYPLWMYKDWRVLPTVPLIADFPFDWCAFDYLNIALLILSLLGIMFAPTRRGWYFFFIIIILPFSRVHSSQFLEKMYHIKI